MDNKLMSDMLKALDELAKSIDSISNYDERQRVRNAYINYLEADIKLAKGGK